MAEPVKYVILVKDKTGANSYEFEKATSLSWEWYENEVGRCKFVIPYNDVKLSSTSIPDNAFSEILIYRNQELVWQGFVAYVEDTKDGTAVYGLTYMEVLKYARTGYYGASHDGTGFEFTNAQLNTIITSVYNAHQSDHILKNRITLGTIQTVYQTGTSTAKTITKTLFDETLFELLTQFVAVGRADSPSGAWKQDTVFEVTFNSSTPILNFWRDVGTNKSDVIFELDSEIVDFNFGVDLRWLSNSVGGYGIQEGPKVLLSSQTDSTSITTYYRRHSQPFFGQVTTQSQLNEMTKDFLTQYKDPIKGFAIKLVAGLKPFDGYSMGDSIRVRINRGRVNVDQFFRVVGMEVNLDQNGVEVVNPQLQIVRT